MVKSYIISLLIQINSYKFSKSLLTFVFLTTVEGREEDTVDCVCKSIFCELELYDLLIILQYDFSNCFIFIKVDNTNF